MKCNELLDWAEVIAIVQSAQEPIDLASVDKASVAAAIAEDETAAAPVHANQVVASALSMPAADVVSPDPFSQRLD